MTKNFTKAVAASVAMFAVPTFVFAVGTFEGSTLQTLLNAVSAFFQALVPFFILAAGVLFMWGLVKYVSNASDEAAKDSAKTLMIWGMVAIFVMVSFWGIIGFFSQTLNLTDSTVVVAPPSPVLLPQ